MHGSLSQHSSLKWAYAPSMPLTLRNRKGTGPGSQADLSPARLSSFVALSTLQPQFLHLPMDIATPARRTVVGNKTMSEENSKHGKLSECLLDLSATTECHNFPRNCSSAGKAGQPWMGTQPLPSPLLPVPLPSCCPQTLREGQTKTPAPECNSTNT